MSRKVIPFALLASFLGATAFAGLAADNSNRSRAECLIDELGVSEYERLRQMSQQGFPAEYGWESLVRSALSTERGWPAMNQVYLLSMVLDPAGLEWMSGGTVTNPDGSVGIVLEFWKKDLPLYALGERILITYNYDGAVVRGVWKDGSKGAADVTAQIRRRSVSWLTIAWDGLWQNAWGMPRRESECPLRRNFQGLEG